MLVRLLVLRGVIDLYGIKAIINETPRNIVVVEGSSIQLNFTSNDTGSYMRWFHRRTDLSEETLISACPQSYTNNEYKYLIDKVKTVECNLLIHSASMSSAGLYKCNEFRTRHNACAEVTVLASKEPVCNFSVIYGNMSEHNEQAESTLILRCRIAYRGNWVPSLKILNQTVAIESSNITVTEEDVTAMVTVPLEACHSNRSYKFQCILTFEGSQRKPRNETHLHCTYSTNIPDYFVSIHLEYLEGAEEYLSTCNTISTSIATSQTKNKDLTVLHVTAICIGVVLFIGVIGVIVLLVRQCTRITRNEDTRPIPQPLYETTKCATNVETSEYQELRPTS